MALRRQLDAKLAADAKQNADARQNDDATQNAWSLCEPRHERGQADGSEGASAAGSICGDAAVAWA